jgi:hypothetical protein
MRHYFTLCLLALAAAAPSTGHAAPRASGTAPVVTVQTTRVADLVILGGGFDADLRAGMVCRVTRAGADIAEILLIELRPTSSAAVILSLAPKQSIHAGDLASMKTLKT